MNYAAKMQSVAGAGDVVFSKEYYALPNIANRARECGLEIQEKRLRSSFESGKEVVLLAKPSLGL